MTSYNEIMASLFELERYLDNVNQRIEKTEKEKENNKEKLDKVKTKLAKIRNTDSDINIHTIIYLAIGIFTPIITSIVNFNVDKMIYAQRVIASIPIGAALSIGYAYMIYKIQNHKEKKLVEEGEGKEFVQKIEECEKALKKYYELKEMLVKARESLKEEIINEKVVNEEVVNFDMYEDPTFEDDKIREFSPVKKLKK